MKLVSVYTESHKVFKDKWFLPSLQDDYDVKIYHCDILGSGRYMEYNWAEAIRFKVDAIINTIEENRNEVFIYSDIDVQFFAPTKKLILKALRDNDIICQRDAPSGSLCTGFFALRSNDIMLKLWKNVQKGLEHGKYDQDIFNKSIREVKNVKYEYLPTSFFGGGTFSGSFWSADRQLRIPRNAVMHHANWTKDIEGKIAQLEHVRDVMTKRGRTDGPDEGIGHVTKACYLFRRTAGNLKKRFNI